MTVRSLLAKVSSLFLFCFFLFFYIRLLYILLCIVDMCRHKLIAEAACLIVAKEKVVRNINQVALLSLMCLSVWTELTNLDIKSNMSNSGDGCARRQDGLDMHG